MTPPNTSTTSESSDSTTLSNKAGGPSTGPLNCPRCGAAVPGDATFCTECGNRLRS
jgi:predicted amidophosphoribosyltransferase